MESQTPDLQDTSMAEQPHSTSSMDATLRNFLTG